MSTVPSRRSCGTHGLRFIIECDYFTGEYLEINGGFFFYGWRPC